jgi:S1-C subfamily serine protease
VRVEGPYVYAFGDNRGRVGVIVDTHADATGDKVGARIDGITPGGPAEKAGMKVGDIITRFNGTALGGVKAEDEGASGPGMKLIDLAHALDPGDTVQVEYRRANESRKATLVAEDLGPWRRRMPSPEPGEMEELMFPRGFGFGFGSPWGGIELVKLNPDLGAYFGAREGVLVVSAPRDSTLALKGGDVITTIGGRKPSSPQQAMKILGSYDPGDTVSISVLRMKKAMTVKWVIPEDEDHFYKMAPRMHEEPSWFRLMPKIAPEIEFPEIKIRDVIRTSRAI